MSEFEQHDLWSSELKPKQQPSKAQIKPNEPAAVPTQGRQSVAYYAQTALTETSPAIHYVVLVNKNSSDIQDIRRQLKFEEDKRLALAGDELINLKKRVAGLESVIRDLVEQFKEVAEFVERKAKEEYSDDESQEDEG